MWQKISNSQLCNVIKRLQKVHNPRLYREEWPGLFLINAFCSQKFLTAALRVPKIKHGGNKIWAPDISLKFTITTFQMAGVGLFFVQKLNTFCVLFVYLCWVCVPKSGTLQGLLSVLFVCFRSILWLSCFTITRCCIVYLENYHYTTRINY